jgi:hypothetical protein
MRKWRFVLGFIMVALVLSSAPGTTLAQEPTPPDSKNTLRVGWFRGSRWGWEYTPRPHRMAIWTQSYCGNQEYLGPGGYHDTCSSSHGCIDTWSWWSPSPDAKLGIPLTWWGDPRHIERTHINNYRAYCAGP